MTWLVPMGRIDAVHQGIVHPESSTRELRMGSVCRYSLRHALQEADDACA